MVGLKRRNMPVLSTCLAVAACSVSLGISGAQQTLGGITGTVTDNTGSLIPGVQITIVDEGTQLTRTATSNANGAYSFVNLPIGSYVVTFQRDGFSTSRFPHIVVQADRTATLPAQLSLGTVSTSVTVEATPLLNAVDTTNGYILEKSQIESIPLSTGSFTGLAILSPGVNAELPGGTGVNSGLGNAPIWANGQRDTSNSFQLNGVDGSNLFNGKSTSQVASARVVNNTGVGNSGGGGVEQSAASVYLSIGNAIPTPPPEFLEEVRVNASMYDAQQGSASGAHIDLSTRSGDNGIHGSVFGHRGTNYLNAAPFFFKKDSGIPESDKNPQLHRYIAGGTFSGPIKKDKLFGFIAYQHLHITDQETGDTEAPVPVGLSDSNRTPVGLAALTNAQFGGAIAENGISVTSTDWSSNAVGLAAFQAKNPDGSWLIPNDNGHAPDFFSPYNSFQTGTSSFIADELASSLDWNATSKDLLAIKYFYQHDPNSAPFAISSVRGFTEHLDAGAQVFSINNVQTLRPNLSVTETLGFIREKAYSTNDQPFAPGQAGTPGAAMSTAFGPYFPGLTIVDTLGETGANAGLGAESLNIGPSAASQSSFTGIFQNRIQPSASAILTKGKHSITFGGSYNFTQLNVRDQRTGKGIVASPDLATFAKDWITPYSTNGFVATTYLQGDANRYYRANQIGLYVSDKFQVRPNLTLTAGLRYDWNGGLTEKYGRIFNFDPSAYSYSASADTISNSGIIIAGNNANGTKGISNTTLTGRQWGIAPRLGFAWQPSFADHKVVIRGGSGMYYDRGELYTYLSPGYAAGEISGGPFGISQTPPFVTEQHCPYSSSPFGNTSYLYDFYIPICGAGTPYGPDTSSYSLASPWGPTRGPGPTDPSAADITRSLPNAAGIIAGSQPFTLGAYNPTNKLPYSINFTLNLQWQPRNDMLAEIGYVGNLGRHQVIPLPFNQAKIATTGSPTLAGGPNAQSFSYGYTVLDPNTFAPICVNDPTEANCKYGQMQQNYEGGNVDLRVPYTGFSSESETYTAAGISAYHALQAHFEKRISHGFQAGVSYTYSHTTDEQSALGLFYNGNDPNNLRSGYGSADFDRKHVVDITYSYALPKFYGDGTLAGKITNGWAINGIAIIQSGQPYSIIDYSGAVGSLYYSTFDGITNPIVPLAPGCTAKTALTGASGAFYNENTGTGAALKASCFTIPLVAPGTLGVPNGDVFETGFTSGQRNIFRQTYQKRTDASLVKVMTLYDRYTLRYTFDIFNVTNTSSFDIPSDNVSQNLSYNNAPAYSTDPYSLYTKTPGGLGITRHTIGAPRQIQMSLRLLF